MYFVKMRTFFKEKFGNLTQGPHSHILVMGWGGGGGRGGVRRICLDLKFWPKGIFWSLFMKGTCLDFFGLQKNRDFLGISAQINNNIYTNFTSCVGFFGVC